MPSFTLCPSYIEFACTSDDTKHYCDVLFQFVQTNDLKMHIDNGGFLFDIYKGKLSANEKFAMLLSLFRPNDHSTSSSVSNGLDTNDFLIELTKGIFGQNKILCTYDKQLFIDSEKNIDENCILLDDKDEFYHRIKVVTATVNYVTVGNQSPIIMGDKNKTR